MKRSCILVSFFLVAASASASVLSTATVSYSFNGMVCNQTSTGAQVNCTFTSQSGNSGGSQASSSAAYGNLMVSSMSSNNLLPGLASSGNANASYDQLLVLPGSGTSTIIGSYLVSSFASMPAGGSLGSINQAGTTQTFLFASGGGVASSTVPIMSTIQLGVPFDVKAALMASTMALGGGGTETGSLMLVGFTDANGRALSPQLVTTTPEPGYAGLLGLLGTLGVIRYRRRARRQV